MLSGSKAPWGNAVAHVLVKAKKEAMTQHLSHRTERRLALALKTVWPSGLRRWLKAPIRKGVGSNPTAVIL